MSVFDRLFGKRGAPPPGEQAADAPAEPAELAEAPEAIAAFAPEPLAPPVVPLGGAELPLAPILAYFGAAVPVLEHKAVDLALVRARLADRCRDAGVEPVDPDVFEALSAGLDAEALRRLALLVGALDDPAVAAKLPAVLAAREAEEQVRAGFVGLARQSELLTMELLRKSALRVEGLARAFVASLGAAIEGEAPEVSLERLERLDYARLLSEADRARLGAEARMSYLKKLQEEQAARRPRRGKW